MPCARGLQDWTPTFGFDRQQSRTLPESPLAIATTAQLQTIAAVTLYRHGVPWPDAEDQARQAFQTGSEIALESLVRPIGDVAGLFRQLHTAGIALAVVTTDHRAETEETLRLLGVTDWLDCLVCGDDGLPAKPAPDMLLAVLRRLSAAPARTAVVGDTLGDLWMAARAAVGLKVAVLTGAGDPAALAQQADLVLDSIRQIRVAHEPGEVAGC
jgi:phosphoglycolate phosphatase